MKDVRRFFIGVFFSMYKNTKWGLICFGFFFINRIVLRLFNFTKWFARSWLFTTNHKKLGLMYLLFACCSGLFGTTLSSLIRLELAQPGSLVFAGNANAYHVVMAMHGVIMVFFLVTPVVFGGFGNYFLPVQVGARDVAYPRLNNFSFWVLPSALVIALRTLWEGMKISPLSIKYESGFGQKEWEWVNSNELFLIFKNDKSLYLFNDYDFLNESKSWIDLYESNNLLNIYNNITDCTILPNSFSGLNSYLPSISVESDLTNTMAGWTFTTPFSHSRFTGAPLDWALASLIVATVSSTLTLINLVVTWRYLKGRGSRYQRDFYPIVLLAIFISLRILIIVSPILNAGLFMLIGDRHFHTAFFTVRAGGDMLLFQHIFWFFGHPEVYILVMPAFGIASTLIPYYVRKPLGSKMHMIYAMQAIASMGFVVWGHHMYLVGIDNKARILFFIVTVMIALPASVKVCGWVGSFSNSTTFLTAELFYAIGFVSLFIIGGVTGSFCAHAATDIILHDTYFIIGHFHIMLSGSLMIALFGYIYFNFREFTGIAYNWYFATLQVFYHFFGHILTFVPALWLGYAGMPRRIQDYPWSYASWHSVASFGHVVVLVSIIFFLLNMSLSFYLKKSCHSKNKGLPFVPSKLMYLLINKYYIYLSRFSKQSLGLTFIRKYLNLRKVLTAL